MVKLRLARAGSKKRPVYRIVAADSRSPRDGRFLEQLGKYDPTQTPPMFRIDDMRLEHWLSRGAQASETLHKLILRHRRQADAKPATEAEPAVEAKAKPAAEAKPAEAKPAEAKPAEAKPTGATA